jgi:hypothetical protein
MNSMGPSLCTVQYSSSQKLVESHRSPCECVYMDYNHRRKRERERKVGEWMTEFKKKSE